MSSKQSPRSRDLPAPVEIAGERIEAGTRRRLELPAARLATGSAMAIPVEVVHGLRPGPRLWLSGAIHGDELNGIEVIRQVLADTTPRRLSGTLIAVPIVNVFGFITESRYLPDRRDLNRSFPGSARGSLASRLAHLLMTQVVQGCDHGIDLHTGSDDRTNLPHVRADLTDPLTRELALAFAPALMIHASVRDGSLRAAATGAGARVLVFEGGEARRFNRDAIDAGTAGILRVMKALDMRTTAPSPLFRTPVESSRTAWIRAGRSGLVRLEIEPGDHVTKGQRLGVIKDAFGDRILKVRANRTGIVVGLTRQPHVNRGDALVHVAEVSAAPTDADPATSP